MIRFTKHAQEAISVREIAVDWIEAAVSAPDWIEADRRHPDRTRSYKLPPAGAADPPWMKPCPDAFPAKAGTHRSAAPAAERWTPAFAGEAFNVVAASPTALFL